MEINHMNCTICYCCIQKKHCQVGKSFENQGRAYYQPVLVKASVLCIVLFGVWNHFKTYLSVC